MSKVHIFNHPLIGHKIAALRDKETKVMSFAKESKNWRCSWLMKSPMT